MWEYSLSLRRCLAGRLQGCLRPWITVWCQPSSPPRPCGRWSGGQQRWGLISPCVRARVYESARWPRRHARISTHRKVGNVLHQGDCGGVMQVSALGWRCLHPCTDPGSNLVLSAACLYFSGRLSHRRLGRGDRKVRGAPVDCGPEGESWGGIAEW